MSALVVRGDSLRLPLRDASVDLIVCSPPYFALRSYRDGGEHFEGQIGSEPHPRDYLEALWSVMAECWRVLKPTGSCFVNLGDKRSGSGGGNDNTGLGFKRGEQSALSDRRGNPRRYTQAAFGRAKSRMLLPHRFAIGCEDGLADPEGIGWIVRQDIVWSKLNGLPESVTDRCRDSHEFVFHLTKQGSYFSAVDEVRESYADPIDFRAGTNNGAKAGAVVEVGDDRTQRNDGIVGVRKERSPLGKLPGSVWPLASEPLLIPDAVKDHYGLPDHFAAFPTELVRRIILGWSPSGVCTACGEGRRPVVEKEREGVSVRGPSSTQIRGGGSGAGYAVAGAETWQRTNVTIAGYACNCPDTTAPTKPAVCLDVFGGTGTTAMVARALGRRGYSVDLSADYCRLASWRIFLSGHGRKAFLRTAREGQGSLL